MVSRKAVVVSLAVGAASVLAGSDAFAAASGAATAFSYSGDIFDRSGKPVSGVEVTATHVETHSYSYIDVVKTDAKGHFTIHRATAISGETPPDVTEGVIRLEFRHPRYAFAAMEDLRTFSHAQATHLKMVLSEGRKIHGQVVDADHRPVANAAVEITFGDDSEQRRGATTDAHGAFAFHGLPDKAGALHVLTVAPSQPMLTAKASIAAGQADAGALVASPIMLPPGAVVHELFGMKLVDVDDSLQAAFHLSQAGGVLVLDPGARGRRWELQRGDQFWMVGDKRVKNFAEFAGELRVLRQSPHAPSPTQAFIGNRVRVVWAFRRPEFAGSNTQYLALSAADVAELNRRTDSAAAI